MKQTPMMLCRPDGTVLGKNAQAVRGVRGLRKGGNLFLSLTRRERNLVERGEDEPMILHLDCPGEYRCAWAKGMTVGDERVILLVFFSQLQIDCRDSVMPWLENALRYAGGLWENAVRAEAERMLTGCRYSHSHSGCPDALLDTIREMVRPQPVYPGHVSMQILLEVFRIAAETFAGKQGCQLILSVNTLTEEVHTGDFGACCAALIAYAGILAAMMVCGASTHRVRAEIRLEKERMVILSRMTRRNAPFFAEEENDPIRFCSLFPDDYLTAAASCGILLALGGRGVFSLRDSRRENLQLCLEIPRGAVRSENLHRPDIFAPKEKQLSEAFRSALQTVFRQRN